MMVPGRDLSQISLLAAVALPSFEGAAGVVVINRDARIADDQITKSRGYYELNDARSVDSDPLRPKSHFLPPSDWMNDPNAPFYDASTGYFHLYYQYQTPRLWGHAISRNLVDWTILSTALNYTDSQYTSVPGETPGVYSGSAIRINTNSASPNGDDIYTWLSVSTPTNDMMLFAYPANESDPFLRDYIWDDKNPILFANSTNGIPYGRDPTEAWRCGPESEFRWCVAYATQESEGCPCSGSSSVVVFSSVLDVSASVSEAGAGMKASDRGADGGSGRPQWGSWRLEGTLLNDTKGAVMWECPDFFPLNVSSSSGARDAVVWIMKYSIGPGPSYEKPWGTPGPIDYYTTGIYDSTTFVGYSVNEDIFDEAMLRSEAVVLDNGAFYASKTFLYESPESDCSGAVCGERLLWGWIPEERPVDGHGDPFGWAGAMALPRTVRAYQKAAAQTASDPWYLQTEVVESVLNELHINSSFNLLKDLTVRGVDQIYEQLTGISGSQSDIKVEFKVDSMSSGSQCGLRILSASDGSEYTSIGVEMATDRGGIMAFVDTSHSCADATAAVNRTTAYSATLDLGDAVDSSTSSLVSVQVIADRSVIEVFLADGKQVITRRVYPQHPDTSIEVFAFASCANSTATCECVFDSVQSWKLRDANITMLDEAPGPYPVPDDDGGDEAGEDEEGEIIGIPIWAATLVISLLGAFLVLGTIRLRRYYRKTQSERWSESASAHLDEEIEYRQPLMLAS